MAAQIRNYRPGDLPSIVSLINAKAVEKFEDGTSLEELQTSLSVPHLDPEENVFVAQEQDGQVTGYGMLRFVPEPHLNSFRSWFQVHPIGQGRGLEERLLNCLHARAIERLPQCTTEQVDFRVGANILERERIATLQQFGMKEIRRFWQMARPLPDDPEPARFPDGLIAQPLQLPQDNLGVWEADVEAFRDHWGFADYPFEEWLHYVSQSIFHPELSIVAQDPVSGEVAGLCMVTVNPEESRRQGVQRGWIDILGVRRAYRRRGLGTALLLAGIKNIRDAGLAQAALGCDSENLTGATRIYERVGFKVIKTNIAFSRRIRGEASNNDQTASGATV